MKNLKRNIAQLEKTITQKDEEISRLKADSKYTHVAELELELRTYYNESRRLQKLLEAQAQETTTAVVSSGDSAKADEQLRQLQERNVQLRATNSKLQAQNDQLEQDMKLLSRENTALQKQIEELKHVVKTQSHRTPAEVAELQSTLKSKAAEYKQLEQQHQLKLEGMRSSVTYTDTDLRISQQTGGIKWTVRGQGQ